MDIEYWDAIAETYGADVAQGMLGDRPRPTKPAAPEWDGEGLPPVGSGCECKKYPDHKCKVVGHDTVTANGINVVVKLTPTKGLPFYDAFIPGLFRPLRTKEQRQREELANDIANDLEAYGIDNPKHLASCLAIGMINRGWHKGEQ